MYAVVTSGGKQYRVEAGTELALERLAAEPGSTVTFDRVLLVGDGDQVRVGTPLVEGATVRGTVIGDARGPKLVIYKFRQKVKYRRRTGHRQELTRVRIDAIDSADLATREATKPKRAPRRTAKPKAAEQAEAANEARTTETAAATTQDAATEQD
jgi:large subunit ribosomal protein L21